PKPRILQPASFRRRAQGWTAGGFRRAEAHRPCEPTYVPPSCPSQHASFIRLNLRIGKWHNRAVPETSYNPGGDQRSLSLQSHRAQRSSETEFVAVGVGKVEEALAPFSIAGHGGWLQSRGERELVNCVNIGNV